MPTVGLRKMAQNIRKFDKKKDNHNKSTDVQKSNICTFFDFVLYTFKKIFAIMMKQFNLYYLMLFNDK